MPVKDLGKAYSNINNDYIGQEECKNKIFIFYSFKVVPGNVRNILKVHPTET